MYAATAIAITVGVFGLLIAFAARQWGTTPLDAPDLFPDTTFHVGNSVLTLGDFGLFLAGIVPVMGDAGQQVGSIWGCAGAASPNS